MASKRTRKRPPHPLQPFVRDPEGVLRFSENPLVRRVYEVAEEHGVGLNALVLDGTPADFAQLLQLLGYSVSGYETNSAVPAREWKRVATALEVQGLRSSEEDG